MGILDQISILRSPATADLKQDQYSTKMVQSAAGGLLRFTTLLSEALAYLQFAQRGFAQRFSRWIPIARKLKNHPRAGSRNQ